MTSRDFCFWAQGFFELADPKELTAKQVDLFKKHLNLVFFHEIDPSCSADPKVQQAMTVIHEGKEAEATFSEFPPPWKNNHNGNKVRC